MKVKVRIFDEFGQKEKFTLKDLKGEPSTVLKDMRKKIEELYQE